MNRKQTKKQQKKKNSFFFFFCISLQQPQNDSPAPPAGAAALPSSPGPKPRRSSDFFARNGDAGSDVLPTAPGDMYPGVEGVITGGHCDADATDLLVFKCRSGLSSSAKR